MRISLCEKVQCDRGSAEKTINVGIYAKPVRTMYLDSRTGKRYVPIPTGVTLPEKEDGNVSYRRVCMCICTHNYTFSYPSMVNHFRKTVTMYSGLLAL